MATSGIAFRSRLEGEIAAELDAHEVEWTFEQPVALESGRQVRYLPDFTIHDAPEELRLPPWVEGKPQQFLYDLRDTLGITRSVGEYFTEDVVVEDVDADELTRRHIDELWKPKKLAEMADQSVLVVGGVGGTNRLSVEMRPTAVVFSRSHPFPNWRGYQRKLERATQQAVWAKEAEARRNQYEVERQEQEERRSAEQQIFRDAFIAVVQMGDRLRPRFGGPCTRCGVYTTPDQAGLYRIYDRWVVACEGCERAMRRAH